MSRKTLLKQLYLVAIDTPEIERLQFQYSPRDIKYDRNAQVTDIGIVGRNDNLHQYVTGSTTLRFDLDFYSLEASRQDVKRKIKWLESQLYSEGERPPSRIKIIFGDLFKDEIWIMTVCSATYSNFEPVSGWLPLYATASLTFVRDTEFDLTATDIRTQSF